MLAGQGSAPGLADLSLTLPSADHRSSPWTSGTKKSNRVQQERKAIILQDQAHHMT